MTPALFCASLTAGLGQQVSESEPRQSIFNAAEVAAGKKAFVSNCSFCHGATARGGAQGGPDLTQSNLVRSDNEGSQLGAFLKNGRPDKGMPAFNLSTQTVRTMRAFLRSTIQSTSRRRSWGNEVLVGNALAGKELFHGAGHCTTCHSAERDLKNIGAKYSPAVLQGRLVLPVGDGGYPGLSRSAPPRIRVKVSMADGSTVSGLLVFLSDYAVTVRDSSGERHTIAREGDVPKILTEDPVQAHFDLQAILTDKDMHDLTAYLATLK